MPVYGREQIRHVEGLLRNADKELATKVRKGMRGALDPLKREIPQSALQRMPHRGGYAGVLAKSTKVLIRVGGGENVRAVVTVAAMGKREGRDIGSLNRGVLRHPLFGERDHWYTQAVRPGFIDDPIDEASDRAADAVADALDEVQQHIDKG